MSKGPRRRNKKTAEVQANPAADLEGGGVILRFRKDSCEPLVVKKPREPEKTQGE